MKRFVVAVLAAMALLAGVFSLPAAAVTGVKPPKLDPPTEDGGQPYPLGLGGKYGILQLSWPTPSSTFNLTAYTVTCTPKYFKPPAVNNLSTDPIVVHVDITSPTAGIVTTVSGGGTALNSDYGVAAGVTKLKVREIPNGADTIYPPRACAITSTNALGSKTGKAPKLATSSTPNCSLIAQPGETPPIFPNGVDIKKTTLFTGVEVTSLSNLLFCSTASTTSKAQWSSDQSVAFAAKSKFKRDKKFLLADPDGPGPLKAPKCGTANPIACPSVTTVKKLGLVSGVNTALTLDINGTDIIYQYDNTNYQATGCVMSKPAATDSCVVGPATVGTVNVPANGILVHSTAENIIKPGKAIKSPTIDITFNTGGLAAGTYPIWFKSATTHISIGPNAVDILLKSLPQVISEQALTLTNTYGCTSGPNPPVGCSNPNPAAFGGTDANYGPAAPIATFTVPAT